MINDQEEEQSDKECIRKPAEQPHGFSLMNNTTMISIQDETFKNKGELPPINLSKGLNIEPSALKGGLGGGRKGTDKINEKESGIVCRICLEEEDPQDQLTNPFITPCKCIGSMKFIHVRCVRDWLDAKKQQQ